MPTVVKVRHRIDFEMVKLKNCKSFQLPSSVVKVGFKPDQRGHHLELVIKVVRRG